MIIIATFTYVEINIFSLAILLLIFININNHTEKYRYGQKLFLALMASNAIILVFDTFMWVINGTSGIIAKEANLLTTTLYYILNPIPCMVWSLYVNYQVYRDEKHIKSLLLPFSIPMLINTVFSVLSYFKGYLFFIDEYNIYHRGNFFIIMAVICYLYLACSFIFIIIKKNKFERKYFIPILLFAIPPSIGGLIQVAFYGLSLIWVCMTLSILIIFINVQNNQLYTDHLTGLNNRRQFDYHLKEQVKGNTRRKLLAGIMIDVNSFKEINDLYGHAVGDEALEHTGRILKTCFRKEDFVSRYGGDEFAIIIEINEKSELLNSVNRIKENMEQFNKKKVTPYELSLSIGYDILDPTSGMTIEQFLKHIDNLMYEDKKRQKNLQ